MTTPDQHPDPDQPAAAPSAGTSQTDPRAALERGAHAFDQRAQALGHEAEAAIANLARNPAVQETADLAGRLWGLVLLGVGAWLVAGVTLGLSMPSFELGDLWPVALIALGGIVVLSGMSRRR
jgi:hypothetical protein